MKITLTCSKRVFIRPEEVLARLSVVNDGAEPITIPHPFRSGSGQPRFQIKGPEYPVGRAFALGEPAGRRGHDPGGGARRGREPEMVTLGPGEAREGDAALDDWLRDAEPGRYEVVAELTWKTLRAQSAPVEVAMEALSVRAAAIGVDVGSPRASDVFLSWMHAGEDRSAVFSALCTEEMEHGAHYDPPAGRLVAGCAADARDLLVPWTNGDRKADAHDWRAWREGATLLALASGASEPVRLDLGAPPDRIIRPALMGPSGDLDVFAIGAGGRELLRARFPAPQPPDGAPARPPSVERVALEAPPASGRAALAPRTLGSRPHVALVTDRPGAGGVEVRLFGADAGGALRQIAAALVPDVHVMASSRPGLRIDEDGFVHASMLYLRDIAARRAGVADVTFGPDGEAREVSWNGFGALSGVPVAASLVYSVTPARPVRRDWVVLLEDGSVVTSRSPDEPQVLPGKPARPLELLPLARGTYILVIDPVRGPLLEGLR